MISLKRKKQRTRKNKLMNEFVPVPIPTDVVVLNPVPVPTDVVVLTPVPISTDALVLSPSTAALETEPDEINVADVIDAVVSTDAADRSNETDSPLIVARKQIQSNRKLFLKKQMIRRKQTAVTSTNATTNSATAAAKSIHLLQKKKFLQKARSVNTETSNSISSTTICCFDFGGRTKRDSLVNNSVVLETAKICRLETPCSSATHGGLQGPLGLQGLQGIEGIDGLQGVQGTEGTNGLQGIQGTAGTDGTSGLQGFQGLQGTDGTSGLQGFQGMQGFQGTDGTSGLQGLQGIQGIEGTDGTSGLQGFQGMQGTAGTNGLQGFQGLQGTVGTNGMQGFQGLQGTVGTNGLQGIQGTTGTNGLQGIQGIQGPALASSFAFIRCSNSNTVLLVLSATFTTVPNLIVDTAVNFTYLSNILTYTGSRAAYFIMNYYGEVNQNTGPGGDPSFIRVLQNNTTALGSGQTDTSSGTNYRENTTAPMIVSLAPNDTLQIQASSGFAYNLLQIYWTIVQIT